ncbi:hypothetical protein [Tolypothrix sp. VBCCA 56010]|uniref:hypothetical protein n=1 Tax=Tolypothrix sp. VBCCA 56010 TaxID=3137731 RepID=UPI003D7D8B81
MLCRLRRELSLITVVYGFCGIGMLLASGGTISLNRLSYGIVLRRDRMWGAACARHFVWGRAESCHITNYLTGAFSI